MTDLPTATLTVSRFSYDSVSLINRFLPFHLSPCASIHMAQILAPPRPLQNDLVHPVSLHFANVTGEVIRQQKGPPKSSLLINISIKFTPGFRIVLLVHYQKKNHDQARTHDTRLQACRHACACMRSKSSKSGGGGDRGGKGIFCMYEGATHIII